MTERQRILVTGASGNVGAPLVELLREDGHAVRVGVRRRAYEHTRDGVEAVEFDFADAASFGPAVAGIDALFLLRPPAISDVGPTLNACVDAAVRAGVERIVFLSVVGADRARFIPHAKVEAHVEASGVRSWTFLRAGFFAQNLIDSYRPDIVEDDRIHVAAGRGRAAFVDAADLAEVAKLALVGDARLDRAAPILTGPEALDFDRVAAIVSRVVDREIRYEPASAWGHYRKLRRRGLPRAQAIVVTALHVGLRFGQAERVDPTLAELLGRPARRLEDWVAANREQFCRRAP